MSSAIVVRGAKNVVLDNVFISGFSRGVTLEDSSALLNKVVITRSDVGMVVKRSHVVTVNSLFIKNRIDILAEHASLELIDTVVRTVKMYLSSIRVVHYAVNQYQLLALAEEIEQERNPVAKRRKFLELIDRIFKYAGYAVVLYELIKIIYKILTGY